ncbi:MAG: PEPxxWA-CTERM sorting domain-containing protein, partial [Proteobacteria bacterium]|nr:PEPxxWA-CTERM sorting domain-containing protein [Pseudomonadota bacterium]
GGEGGNGGSGGFNLPSGGDGGTGGGGGGSDGGGKICVVSAITTCGSSESGGPNTFTPFFAAGPTTDQVVPDAVPEPAAWALMILGFLGAGAMLRTRRRKALAA